MRRRRLALLFFLLPAVAALNGCGGAENTNAANTNAIRNTNTNAAATPSPGGTPSTVDDIKAGMGVGNIAFNAPPGMKLDEVQTITLLLSPKQTKEELGRVLQEDGAVGDIKTRSIKMGRQMQAVLTGDGFRIDRVPADAPDTQEVSKSDPTTWKWDVRPVRAGRLSLHVVVNAIVDFNDGRGMRPYNIKTFDEFYDVEVPGPTAAGEAPARYGLAWPWLLPALLVPALGAAAWLWLRGRGRRRAASRWSGAGAGKSSIFLSYRRDDTSGHAGRLRDSLAERFGPGRVFMDLESIGAGEDFAEVIRDAVGSSRVVLVLIGRRWLSAADKNGNRRLDDPRDFVRLEVEAALGRGVRVIPVLVQRAEMPTEDALPEPLAILARRNAIEVSDSRWSFDADRLADAIAEALAQGPARPSEHGAAPR